MSSMRNAVQRRSHAERAQPKERERWGLLEKHKDYSLRAKDYNEKKKKLKILRQKASERNPDEFHFAMMSHKFQDGGKISKTSKHGSMPHETAKLLKTQDAGYLRTMLQSTRKSRQRIEQDFVLQRTQNDLADDHTKITNPQRHIVYVNDVSEQAKYHAPLIRADVDVPADHGREDVAGGRLETDDEAATRGKIFHNEQIERILARKRKLEALSDREKALLAAERELELQRARMTSSVGGVTKLGHKFKIRERKR